METRHQAGWAVCLPSAGTAPFSEPRQGRGLESLNRGIACLLAGRSAKPLGPLGSPGKWAVVVGSLPRQGCGGQDAASTILAMQRKSPACWKPRGAPGRERLAPCEMLTAPAVRIVLSPGSQACSLAVRPLSLLLGQAYPLQSQGLLPSALLPLRWGAWLWLPPRGLRRLGHLGAPACCH